MTDYYPLIARAVEELGRSTGEARSRFTSGAQRRRAIALQPRALRSGHRQGVPRPGRAIRKVKIEQRASHERKHERSRVSNSNEGAPDDSAQVASSRRGGACRSACSGPLGAGGSRCFHCPRATVERDGASRKRKAVKGSRNVVQRADLARRRPVDATRTSGTPPI